MKNIDRLKKGWYLISGYFPVIFMLIFAMITYWLLQVTPRSDSEKRAEKSAHSVDYFMRQFEVTNYEKNGIIKSYIVGAYAEHFPDTDTIVIKNPKIYTQKKESLNNAQKTQGSAKEATSNADATLLELRGDVHLIKEEWKNKESTPVVMKLMSEHLIINSDTEKIISPEFIQIEKGEQKISANSMEYDNVHSHLLMLGNVRAVFQKQDTKKKGAN